jgi:hypothetical protein
MQISIDPNAATMAASRRNAGLDVFFKPRSVAVIGATERSGHVGRAMNRQFGRRPKQREERYDPCRSALVF